MNLTEAFTPTTLPGDLDPETLATHARIVEAIRKIVGEQETCQSRILALHATRAEDIDGNVIAETRLANGRMMELLREELKSRVELATIYKTLPAVFGPLCDRRRQAAAKLGDELRAKLAELGFADVDDRFLLQNASYRQARSAVDSIRARVMTLSKQEVDNEGSPFLVNEARCKRIRDILSAALRNAGVETAGALY